MSDVTQILDQMKQGNSSAAELLLPAVYGELKRLAAARMSEERPDHTLQITALVHEAYLRLVKGGGGDGWNGRAHFFSSAAEAMRRVLIDHARTVQRQKRGHEKRRITLELAEPLKEHSPEELLALNDAIEELAIENEGMAELVKLRLFAGLSNQEAAEITGISASAAKKHWLYARAWLRRKLADF